LFIHYPSAGGGAFETLPGATACWAWLLTSTESGTHGLDGAELMSSAELAASVGAATSLVHRRAAGVAAGAFSERASPSSSVSASSNNDSSSGNGGGRGGERLRRSVGVQSTRGTGSTTPLHRAVRTVAVLGQRSVQLVLDAGGVAARRLRGLQLSDHLHQARRAV
jgi:hypothetical protein